MQPADRPGKPETRLAAPDAVTDAAAAAADAAETDETRIVQRRAPRHGADTAALRPPAVAADFDRSDDDHTVIVQRTAEEHTRIVARRDRRTSPAPDAPTDATSTPTAPAADEATVHSARRSALSDTLLSSRRATAPSPTTPGVDDPQRRYRPPQVQSGRSVRYPARQAPMTVAPQRSAAGPEPTAPDPARIALGEAAAEIRHRAAVGIRRRSRLTLIMIVASTLLVLIAAVAFTGFAVVTW